MMKTASVVLISGILFSGLSFSAERPIYRCSGHDLAQESIEHNPFGVSQVEVTVVEISSFWDEHPEHPPLSLRGKVIDKMGHELDFFINAFAGPKVIGTDRYDAYFSGESVNGSSALSFKLTAPSSTYGTSRAYFHLENNRYIDLHAPPERAIILEEIVMDCEALASSPQ